MIVVAASSPYFLRNLLRALERKHQKKKWREIYYSLYYLKRQGYIELLEHKDGGIKVKITKKGSSIIKQVDIENLQLKKSASWDQKWRVVIFDVPNWKSKNRLAFTEKLKNIGFRMIQKSVWAYPHECHEEIMILRKFYDIEREVTYLETAMVEDEETWRKHFVHVLSNLAYAR